MMTANSLESQAMAQDYSIGAVHGPKFTAQSCLLNTSETFPFLNIKKQQ